MVKKFLIGVDLGTSATKASIFTPNGNLIAEKSTEVPIHYPTPGVVEQDMDDFYSTAAQTVRDCLNRSNVDPKEIAAISFDSQMAGVGLIDENYNQVGKFDSWLDMRCEPYIRAMDEIAGVRMTELTGCPPICDHGPKILWWQHELPELYKKTAKFVMPAAYVSGKLCGLRADQAYIDYTFIHFSGVSDAKEGKWSQELCDKFSIELSKLPQIVEPWKIVGEVSGQGAKAFGLEPGTPVAAGAGDTAANAIGAGIVRAGQIFDVAGTAAVLAGSTDEFVADVKHRALLTMRSVIPGLWNPLAYIAGGGIIMRWVRDELCKDLAGERRSMDDIYESVIMLAEKVEPGADGLLFSPHLGGRICPSTPAMRGAWIGLSWSHSRSHMIRAALESVAFEYAYYMGILKELLPDLSFVEARVIGGGAKSRVWNQIKADVLNVPYLRLTGSEYGTWGAALISGKAVGLIDDLASHASECALLKKGAFKPNRTTHDIYDPILTEYIRSQNFLADYFSNVLGKNHRD